MAKRPITPTYILFYILFLPDSWRILMGVAAASLITPYVLKPDVAAASGVVVFLMLATIGYAVTGGPAKWITGKLKKLILGDQVR